MLANLDPEDTTPEKPGKARRNIQSIEVGFQLIRALEQAPGRFR